MSFDFAKSFLPLRKAYFFVCYPGILSVANPLDYESTKNYMLTVEARDLGEPPLSTQALVNISVIDSNDNTPIFLQTLYTTVVPEDANVGSSIIQVRIN